MDSSKQHEERAQEYLEQAHKASSAELGEYFSSCALVEAILTLAAAIKEVPRS